jgi:ABC-type branched-subunit amino acid transport system ATPase component
MAEIELRNVTKHFPGATAIRDVSFTIHDGEFFILVGPSGCGKSTLLNMIVGLEAVTEGEILMDGKRINDLDPKDRNMAMVFQSYALYPHMTIRENMSFPLRLARLPGEVIDRHVAKAAESHERYPAASASGWPWAAQLYASPASSCSTSRFQISTQSCVYRCAPRLPDCNAGSGRPLFTSRMTKPRR